MQNKDSFVCQLLDTLKFERGGVLLTGSEGLGQKEDAYRLAEKFLCGEPMKHPDFISFDEMEDEDKIIGLIQSLSNLPARADRRIVYIPNIDQRGEVIQNKLLKIVEESDAFFICTAQGDALRTIASRLMVIPYSQKPLAQHISEGGDAYSWFCSGDEEVGEIFSRVYDAIIKNEPKEVFAALNLVKEKDKEAFCEVHRCFVPSLFCLIGKALCDKDESLVTIGKAIKKANITKDKYSIPEFFSDIAELIS